MRDVRVSSSSNSSAWTMHSGQLSGASNQLPDLLNGMNGMNVNLITNSLNGGGLGGNFLQQHRVSSDGGLVQRQQQQQQQQLMGNLPLFLNDYPGWLPAAKLPGN